MEKRKIGILTECVCDLPEKDLEKCGVDILYFLVKTENGVFTDSDEITAENVISYLESGDKKAISSPPPPEVYFRAFEKYLRRYDEIIHIAISSGTSESCNNARAAVEMMGAEGRRVHIFDSEHLSTGMGFLVLRAAELANQNCSCDEILRDLEELRGRVSTSFIARNADYLYRNGRVSLSVKKLCTAFKIHPVLTMKNGKLQLKTVILGKYESACRQYVRQELRNNRRIDKSSAFITHVGCSLKMLKMITAEVDKCCKFDELKITSASATVSSNCGQGTFGVLYVRTPK